MPAGCALTESAKADGPARTNHSRWAVSISGDPPTAYKRLRAAPETSAGALGLRWLMLT